MNFFGKNSNSPKQKQRAIIICTLVLAILIAAVIVLSNGGDNTDALKGVWQYDEHTEYEFDGNGSGCLRVDGSGHYDFAYTVDGDTLKLDFEQEYVTDCEYGFKLADNTLTLVGGSGTANPGQEYKLTKIEK